MSKDRLFLIDVLVFRGGATMRTRHDDNNLQASTNTQIRPPETAQSGETTESYSSMTIFNLCKPGQFELSQK